MSQPLQLEENKFDRKVCLKEVLDFPISSDFGYFLEVDLRYLYKKTKKNKTFSILS